MYPEPVQQVYQVGSKAHTDGHVGDGVFEYQVPTDNPRYQFAHRRVGVGIGAACDGNHGRHFGVAKSCECAHHGNEHHGDGKRRSSSWPADQGLVMDQEIEQRRVDNGFGVEFFSGNGGAYDGENTGADDGPNS